MSSLPTGWMAAEIKDLVQYNPKTDAPDELPCGFVPMHGLGTRFRSTLQVQAIRPWGEVKKAYTHFRTGDVLVAKVTPCFENGKAGVAPALPNGIGAGSSEFCVFRPTEGVDGRYLLGWLSTDDFRRRATVAMTGSVGLKRVPKDVFLTESMPLAPINEQRRIADKLDAVLARVDSVNDLLARVAPLLKRFRQSVLAAATSGRLTSRSGETDLASIAGSWGKARLSQIAHRVSVGHVGLTSEHYTSADDGIPFLRSQNVRPGRLSKEGLVYITKEFHLSLRKSQLQAGDLLVVRVGANRGDSCIVPMDHVGDLNCANVVFARPDTSIVLPQYLAIFFQSPDCQSGLLSSSVGGAQGVINTAVVGSVEVPLPSIPEQEEIVRRVELLFACADRLEARLQVVQTAAERLTPALLAKAFRGELVPQDPNDEPASELLKRLTAQRAQAGAPSARPRGRKPAALAG